MFCSSSATVCGRLEPARWDKPESVWFMAVFLGKLALDRERANPALHMEAISA